MKYLLNVVETYRVDTVEEALAMRDEMAAANDYLKIDYMSRQNNLEDSINSEMNKINSLFNKYL